MVCLLPINHNNHGSNKTLHTRDAKQPKEGFSNMTHVVSFGGSDITCKDCIEHLVTTSNCCRGHTKGRKSINNLKTKHSLAVSSLYEIKKNLMVAVFHCYVQYIVITCVAISGICGMLCTVLHCTSCQIPSWVCRIWSRHWFEVRCAHFKAELGKSIACVLDVIYASYGGMFLGLGTALSCYKPIVLARQSWKNGSLVAYYKGVN